MISLFLSFDDTFIAESETPCLTSVGYNYDKFAGALVETAILAIEGKKSAENAAHTPQPGG